MAMDFWEAQRRARFYTTLYLVIFIALTLLIATLAELALRFFAQENYSTPIPLFGLTFLGITFLVAAYNYGMYKEYGGRFVAESVGARPVDPNSHNPKERRLVNIVEEMALAASLPPPYIYIIPANEINAFAAGLTPGNAAIAITEGSLERLNRDEIQGVIAHEFGHIYNGDMKISMRLAAMIMGFFFALYIGLRLIQISSFRSRREDGKGGNPLMIAALLMMAAGSITWLAGTILKAMVSRECEYRADACAVQFTRNPHGIANALRKIEKESIGDMPKTGAAFSHMYLQDNSFISAIFATHPPIKERIAVIEGLKYREELEEI